MKSVIIAACGALAMADIADETVLLQVRVKKTMDPAAGGGPPMGGEPKNETLGDFFDQFEDSPEFLGDVFKHCDEDPTDPMCMEFDGTVLPSLPDPAATHEAIYTDCMNENGEDCEHVADEFSEFLLAGVEEQKEEDFMEEGPPEWQWTPCEEFAIDPLWDWETGEEKGNHFWPATAHSCEMETTSCGQAPWCSDPWFLEWGDVASDPYCTPEKFFDNEEDWFTCADVYWYEAHPPCATDFELEIGWDHPSGMPTAKEHFNGTDALCMVEFDCSDGFTNWDPWEKYDMCVCDGFWQGDHEEFQKSYNYYWIDEMCMHQMTQDDHWEDDSTGTWDDSTMDPNMWTQIKKASKMHKKSPGAAKRFMAVSGLKRKGIKAAFQQLRKPIDDHHDMWEGDYGNMDPTMYPPMDPKMYPPMDPKMIDDHHDMWEHDYGKYNETKM